MNTYIAMILQDKKDIEREIEAVLAPYRKRLDEADKALAALGYKEDEGHPVQKNSPTLEDLARRKGPTIKQRVEQALSDGHPNGAYYSDILEYINTNWPHLQVKRTSLSPQLTRLRQANVIELDEDKGIWFLVEKQEPKKNEGSSVGAQEPSDFFNHDQTSRKAGGT